jgi:hypothetical protein
MTLLISASQVAGITGVKSYAWLHFLDGIVCSTRACCFYEAGLCFLLLLLLLLLFLRRPHLNQGHEELLVFSHGSFVTSAVM